MHIWRTFKSDTLALACLFVLAAIILLGAAAPIIAPNDPVDTNLKAKFAPMSLQYPFGADHLGRCVFSRLLFGIRTTVWFSLIATMTTVAIGTLLGVISGYFKGWVDETIMRLCDVMLSFPSEVMILAVVGMLGPGLENIVIANIIAKWPWYTRMIRSIILQNIDKNFIRFSKVSGSSHFHIMKNHLLPGAFGEIFVLGSLDTGVVILNISALSFLGLGVQAPTPEWGMMLNEAKNIMTTHPTQMLAPGIAVLVVVAAFNFIGDKVRDILDPKHMAKEGKKNESIESGELVCR
ncbi:nickel/cobalt ABC transporter permease [Geosporobacter ferrireducens]|uniref:Nickel ABC transporter permease subunit NikC n=1 Tax=Geosporobacter ferrireducens TaxID=1424294 RepID=A0A1D8GL44_9FIRM|nr:nickel/cobalt ABC transporter permease [Geosporobacter ferrireducens]AOT71621.1 nickel ABC transporter permease subunit NikC [Geosporobacter ferrireducens]